MIFNCLYIRAKSDKLKLNILLTNSYKYKIFVINKKYKNNSK